MSSHLKSASKEWPIANPKGLIHHPKLQLKFLLNTRHYHHTHLLPPSVLHSMAADYERQRSSSFSDLTPRGNARTLPSVEGDLAPPPSQLRSLFSAPGSVGSSVSLALNSSRKGSALSIRDPVSGSGRASPAFSTVRAAVRQNSGSTPFRSLEAYSQRNVAAALESGADLSVRPIDDVWQAVCVRVLPLLCVHCDIHKSRHRD